ncbi:hypothetical protein [Rhizobium leguminosarum]|uniref:hypothetical protein n=1 Tax=Rhizobium leguminosarum TaxID=384 RepID=UPI0015585ABF|nr:hypothetical protein [Rhizobium leguminosarum]
MSMINFSVSSTTDAAPEHGQNDDVARWHCAICPRRRSGCELIGQRQRLGRVAIDRLYAMPGPGDTHTHHGAL